MSDATREAPDLDYLTRDYRGLREQLIALVGRSGTPWAERSPADVGMVVLEALAYQLDHLAYAGDRVASEGFLRTARSRHSVRLHAALGDYTLDRGSTSRGIVHFTIAEGSLSLGTGYPVGPRLEEGQDALDRDVFETTEAIAVDARRSRFRLRKSVAAGARVIWLGGARGEPLDLWGAGLRPGMRLALVSRDRSELVSVARVQSSAVVLEVPAQTSCLAGGSDRAGEVLGNLAPIRRGRWGAWRLLGRGGATRDELPLALYFQRRLGELQELRAMAELHREAWLPHADLAHAWRSAERSASLAVCRLRTVSTEALSGPLLERVEELIREAADALRGLLEALGLTIPEALQSSRCVTIPGQRVTLPVEEPPLWLDDAVTLEVSTRVGGQSLRWTEVDDLLRSGPGDRHYVVEIAGDRDVALRFGDGRRGALVAPGAPILARWVSGDPALGDVGRDALTRALGPASDRLEVRNPLATAGARPAEPLDRVADRLRRGLTVPAIPITGDDHVDLLERRAEVIEAALLPIKGRMVQVAVRLGGRVDVGLALPALQRWLDTHHLAGTAARVLLARPCFVSVTALVRSHLEITPEALRARCRRALRELFGDREGRLLGRPCTRAEVHRALEAVDGVEWSELLRFERASSRADVVAEVIEPARDQLLRCLDEPEQPETGEVEVWIAREYSAEIELLYEDPDLAPPADEVHAALIAALSGPRSVPVRERWPVITPGRLHELLEGPAFAGEPHALRLRALIRGDRRVDEITLRRGDAPVLTSLQVIPRRVESLP